MNRLPRSAKSRRRARSGSRQSVIVLAVGLVIALGVLATGEFVMAKRQPVATLAGAGEVYTGSILYMPDDGKTCRQLKFDNQNGRFTDNGYVDCDHAALGADGTPGRTSSTRLRVISNGFSGH